MDDPSGNNANKFQDFLNSDESAISLDRTIYFIPESVPSSQKVFTAIKNTCVTFDDVLIYLEQGKVDKIIFHPMTSAQTRRYIVHWAKVFNPNIVEQLTTHFPSKGGSPQVA